MTTLTRRPLELIASPAPAPAADLELVIAAWLDAKRTRSGSAKTARAYTDTMASFRACLHGLGLDLDADPRAVAFAAQGWAGQSDVDQGGDVAPATYNLRLAIMSSFYAFALKRGMMQTTNPIGLVERRSVQEYAGASALDLAELRQRLAAIDRSELAGARDYALLAIYLQTGRRLSEVAALRWGDTQLAGGKLTLHFRHCKGGKVMSDTLPKPVAQALLGWLHLFYGAAVGSLAPDSPLWVSLARSSSGAPLGIRSIARICTERLGVSKVHALRHTFARTMEDAGAKVSDIQARLGHSSLATTGKYLAALKRAENDQADTLAALFGLDD